MTDRSRRIFAAVVLMGTVLAVYRPVGDISFVSCDDPDYVVRNLRVREGLTWEGARWAFGAVEAANWHPLTWISHVADVDRFGSDAGWHHRVNMLLHGVNAILLFLALGGMTGAPWRSAFVAALFAVHPLHVESVAWAAERKDVLRLNPGHDAARRNLGMALRMISGLDARQDAERGRKKPE